MRRHKRYSIIIIFTIILSLLLTNNLLAENRLALLIGNSNYTHGGSLNNSVTDVRAMKRALEDLGFTVLKYENCTQKTMKRAMDNFGIKLKGQDVGLFFYSGHGVQVNGHNYLIPTNAKLHNENDTEYDCVRADRVLAKMESAGTKTSIVILDACRDNPFERSWRKGTKGTGLAFMNAPSGSLIAYSTAPGKTALDGRGKNSPYTSALLQHIGTANITVLEMFQGVRSTVMARTGGKQTPWESTSLRGNFYFNDEKGIAVEHQKKERARTNGRLFVNTEPENARVRILNIKPRFYQGMDLNPGEYHIEISASGYKTKKGWVELTAGEDEIISVQLEPIDLKETQTIEGSDVLALINQAKNLQKSDKHLEAIKILDKAIELYPKNSWVYTNRGNAYFNLKQYIKAIQNYDKAIELDPKNASDYYRRGLAYTMLKQYIKAIQDFNNAIDLDSGDARIYSMRGRAYLKLKQYDKAIQDYDKAIELNPGYAWTYDNRGRAYLNLKQYTRAIQDYGKVIELVPNHIGAYHIRGSLYDYLKQYARAIQDYDKAIELNSGDATIYFRRGRAYAKLKQYDRAIQDYDKAIELNPGYTAAYRIRGATYISTLKRNIQGCADMKKACELGDCLGWETAIKGGFCP